MTSKKGGDVFSKSDTFLLKLTWNKLQGKIDSLAINSFDNMFQARKTEGPCYFILLLYKSSIWFTEKQIFKIIIYFFNALKCAANYVIYFEVYDGFIGQKI